ncbi:MAG: 50S ribosomal protein L32 [Defluviitaleaceae bacterium]|nr:50S ribosomal protein L32 [Defluviitaleaceae bacterium]
MIGPKNKSSKGRRNKRRAQSFKIAKATLAVCPSCSEYKLPHTICKACGNYKKVEYIKKD